MKISISHKVLFTEEKLRLLNWQTMEIQAWEHTTPQISLNHQATSLKKKKTIAKKNPPGPGEYDPQWSYEIVPRGIQTGISIGNAVRREETGTYKLAPASNTYNTLGDFDFKDTTLPAGEVLHDRGKQPKFAFGGKHKIKSPSAEFPGPAEYETDVYPMSNKNVAYWIGTDVRRDLSVPYSHMYPGPGLYNPDNPSQQIAAHFS